MYTLITKIEIMINVPGKKFRE